MHYILLSFSLDFDCVRWGYEVVDYIGGSLCQLRQWVDGYCIHVRTLAKTEVCDTLADLLPKELYPDSSK